MKVADILARKGSVVVTIRPVDSIAMLSRLLGDKRIGAVVVSSDGKAVDGVISERDIAYAVSVHKSGLDALPVSALMTKAVIMCSPNDGIAKVASTMLARNIRHLPVHDGTALVGMVSIRDVLNSRLEELQHETALLRTFVNQTDRDREDR